ncbi:hypothetical protein [Stomatohabitans albus]|uniref:hypothetical protein n=1 Tax=Stomatohabitans albus TaxID=3110766 RepID=UPI00300D121D
MTITTTCTRCGRIQLQPDGIDLRIDTTDPDAAIYGFSCPRCDTTVVRRAGARVVRLLVASGVPARSYASRSPACSDPVIVIRDPAPFTTDDLLDFHVQLKDDAWIERLLQA